MEQTIPKWSGACYAIRSMFHISNVITLKVIYLAYFNSVMKYGITGVTCLNSGKIFTVPKKIIRIMVVTAPRTSCRNQLNKSDILPVLLQ
jgi:hypothetical protein